MQRFRFFGKTQIAASPPAQIAVGLAVLVVGSWYPDAPSITAIALIALGAIETARLRFIGTPALLPIIVLNASAYAGLYGIFIGARLHSAAVNSSGGVAIAALFDIAASVLPFGIAAQRVCNALASITQSEQ